MPLQKRPVTSLDDLNQRRRDREVINQILDHSFDDSRVQTKAEKLAGVTPINPAYEPGNVLRYGAKGDDSTINDGAFEAALAVANATFEPMQITFPEGIYRISTSQNWYLRGLTLQALGRVVIKSTASSGYIMRIDAGAASNGYNFKMLGNFMLDSTNEGVGTGLYTRNVHHSEFTASIRNVVSCGCIIEGAVLSTYNIYVTATHGGAFTTTPVNGITIDGSAVITQSTDNYFNLVIETCSDDGVVLIKCAASIFYGTAEGLGGKGVQIASGTYNFDNVFINFFCEANTGGDYEIEGDSNTFIGCTGTNTTNAIKLLNGADRNRFIGGTFHDAVIDSGALGTFFDSCYISTTITDSAPATSRTQKINVLEFGLSGAIRAAQLYIQEDWNNASYSGTWTNTSGTYKPLQYTKNFSTSEVLLRGEAGSGGDGTVITVLPADYRPAKSYSFICAANAADDFASVTVDTSGNVTHTTGGYTTSIDLSSVRFFTN